MVAIAGFEPLWENVAPGLMVVTLEVRVRLSPTSGSIKVKSKQVQEVTQGSVGSTFFQL